MVYFVHQDGGYYWFYLHAYYCFHKDADSNYGFTCGFDVAPVTAFTANAEILHCPHVPEVVAVVHVPADLVAGTAEVLTVSIDDTWGVVDVDVDDDDDDNDDDTNANNDQDFQEEEE